MVQFKCSAAFSTAPWGPSTESWYQTSRLLQVVSFHVLSMSLELASGDTETCFTYHLYVQALASMNYITTLARGG